MTLIRSTNYERKEIMRSWCNRLFIRLVILFLRHWDYISFANQTDLCRSLGKQKGIKVRLRCHYVYMKRFLINVVLIYFRPLLEHKSITRGKYNFCCMYVLSYTFYNSKQNKSKISSKLRQNFSYNDVKPLGR